MKRITIIGSGYVGFSLAVLLSKKHLVCLYDIDDNKIELVNNKVSPINDADIEKALESSHTNITATANKDEAFKFSNMFVVATPTNYIEEKNCFDTQAVDGVIEDIFNNHDDPFVIIKSTIPIGHTKALQNKLSTKNIIFSPEFLREGKALHDNLYPSRIIIGNKENCKQSQAFEKLLTGCAIKKNIDVIYTSSCEAEAIKLFSNTYLAMRVAFFNELDSYAIKKKLDAKNIINGICLDNRIGDNYNNPSFGYGGYCLPKDSKQLSSHFSNVPSDLIGSIIKSNKTRKDFISSVILQKNHQTIGFYRINMKDGSDNYRDSAVLDIIKNMTSSGKKVLIFEPLLQDRTFLDAEVVPNLKEFCEKSDLIISNRTDKNIEFYSEKVFTRDLFQSN